MYILNLFFIYKSLELTNDKIYLKVQYDKAYRNDRAIFILLSKALNGYPKYTYFP